MTDNKFYYPMILHRDTSAGALSVPWVNQLPLVQEVVNSVYVLTSDEGIGQGVYTWDGSRFRFSLPYPDICAAVIGGATIDIYYDLTTAAPIPSKAVVWRNGLPFTGTQFTAGDGAVWAVLVYPLSAAGDIKSVNGQHADQTGNVVVKAIDNNPATGTSLIVNNGALTGNIALKTIVAGSGITLAPDGNGNLQISGANQYVLPAATATTLGGVIVPTNSGLSIDASGNISNQGVLQVSNATATGANILVTANGSGGGTATIKQIRAGSNVTITSDATSMTINAQGNVQSVSGQTGAVVVSTVDNNPASGTSLISDSGATTGTAKLKTLVAGSGIAISPDANGNLQIIASNGLVRSVNNRGPDGSGNVTLTASFIPGLAAVATSGSFTDLINVPAFVKTVSGQAADGSGNVVVQTTDNNAATGTSLIVNSGATTANAKLKTLVAGTLIAFATDANGNLIINSTATSGALTAVNSEGTGTSLVDNNGTAGGIATIKSLAAGSNITITPSGDAKTLTIAANQVLNPATTTTIGGVIVGAGLSVDGTGKIALAAPTGVNLGGVKAGSGISIAADGTISVTAVGGVTSVSTQTGAVVVQATNNNAATGTSLISDSGSTTANIKLKTLVAGSGVTITPDSNGNLSIASTATGGVSSITAGTSGALTGAITFTAGPSISLANTGNSVQISGTGVPEAPNDGNGYMRQNLGWTVVPSIANAITSITGQTGTGAVLLVEANPPANSAIIKSLVAGQNVTLAEANGLITVSASIPAGTVATVNGVSPNGSGNVTLTAATVNAVPIAGNVTMTGPLNFGSQVVNGIPTPANPSDAVPLSFLQGLTIDGGVIG